MKNDTLDLFAWPDDQASIGVVLDEGDRAELLTDLGLAHLIPPAKVGQCRFCIHAESDHQKGGETYRSSLHFKPGVANSGDKAPFLGTNRYCHEALCSCIHYHHAHCACPTRLVACTYVPGGHHGG